jgi:alkyl hydroperoxide reductase subunit AhpF
MGICLLGNVAHAQSFTNSTPIQIFDESVADPYPSTITVSGISSPIDSISITLNGFSHTFPDDVAIMLVGPTGEGQIVVPVRSGRKTLVAVVLGGNTVRPVTVAMFNFISLEQTQWAKLAAAAMIAMAPVILLGLAAQRHIVKGLTVGAVKGGGRR